MADSDDTGEERPTYQFLEDMGSILITGITAAVIGMAAVIGAAFTALYKALDDSEEGPG
jgi:hypothetical protein